MIPSTTEVRIPIMKLNNKRTILVGFAFLSICAFWQMYDNVVPLILSNTFRLNETWTGVIMAADNMLALFLLPLFGGLSDKVSTKIGRRMPFIVGGTIAAVTAWNGQSVTQLHITGSVALMGEKETDVVF